MKKQECQQFVTFFLQTDFITTTTEVNKVNKFYSQHENITAAYFVVVSDAIGINVFKRSSKFVSFKNSTNGTITPATCKTEGLLVRVSKGLHAELQSCKTE